MLSILQAYLRALRSLASMRGIWQLLWPALLSLCLWGLGLYFAWGPLAESLRDLLARLPWMSWLADGWGASVSLAGLRLLIFLVSVFMALLLSVLMVAIFSLPMLVDSVATAEYGDLVAYSGGSMLGSAFNAGKALAILLLLCLFCLPIWFIPGFDLAAAVLLSAWFNRRCFRYDALMKHANVTEMRQIPAQTQWGLLAIGIIGSLLGMVPFINLLAPVLTGLAMTHYLLSALRVARARAVNT